MAVRSLKNSTLENFANYSSSMNAGYDFNDFELIESVFVASPTASVTFSSLGDYSTIYKHLQLRIVPRLSGTGGQRSSVLQINGDTASNYRSHFLLGTGSTVTSFESGSSTRIFLGIGGNESATNEFGGSVIDILDAYSTTKNKTVRSLGGLAGGVNQIALISGLRISTDFITSLTLLPETTNYLAGSRFSLYGIR